MQSIEQPPQISGDEINVGTVEGGAVAIGIGARATVYQGLSVEQVTALFDELKHKDQPQVWNGRIPYLGLNAFQESDSEFYFGREELVDGLLKRVKTARFITIAGPSGSGKSSVARAGLFHALRQGRLDRSEKWLLATMQPKGEPLAQLALAIDRLSGKPGTADSIRENGSDDPEALQTLTEILLTDDKRQRFVLLVDQFEEVFTQTKDVKDREAFISLLTTAAQSEDGRMIIVLSLRSDFVSNCALYPELSNLLSQQFQLVGAMEPSDLAKAITLPALEVGAEIEPALVKQIIDDMRGEPGALPLMSFALRDLFEAEKSAKGQPMDLTLEEYLQLGGIVSALKRHADRVFDSFTDEQKTLAKGIFSKLITVGEGRPDTRRTAVFEELKPAGVDEAEVAEVVSKLSAEGVRLVTTSGQTEDEGLTVEEIAAAPNTVTIAHEKLIDAWPWLSQLVDENRDTIRMQNEIAAAARDWKENDREASYLYTGARLATVEEQVAANELQLGSNSKLFVDASIARRRSARRRSQMAIFGLVLITVAAVAAAFLAIRATRQATAQRMVADARLAAEKGQLRLASLLTIEATERDSSSGPQLWNDVLVPNTVYREVGAFTGHQEDINSVTWDAQGERLATTSDDGTARIWDAASGDELAVLNHKGFLLKWVKSAAWDPQGERLATASANDKVHIWNAASGDELAILEGHNSTVNSVAWDADGERLASAADDGTVRIWDAANGTELAVLEGHQDWVYSVAWHPDSERLASGSRDDTVRIWDVANGTELLVLEGHNDDVNIVTWDTQGERLATAADDGIIRIWDAANGTELANLDGHQGWVKSIAWHPDGERLASTSDDYTVRIWDVANGIELAVLEGNQDLVNSVAWDAQGTRLASAGWDDTVHIWEVAGGPELAILEGHQASVDSVAWDPEGERLASGSTDNTVRIWDAVSGTELMVLEGHEGALSNSVAWDAKGELLASGSCDVQDDNGFCEDGEIIIWDVASGVELAVFKGHQDRINSVAWEADGERLASASADETVRIWDAASGAQLALLEGHKEWVNSVAWDADGERLASGSDDRTVRIWDAAGGGELAVLKGHNDSVNSVAWDREGERLASASEDNTVRIWDAADGDELAVLKGHKYGVNSVVWDASGERLASGSCEKEDNEEFCTVGEIIIWDGASGDKLAVLKVHEGMVNSVAWDTAGERLASAAVDGNVHLRAAKSGCERILSNFTVTEWRSYVGTTLPYSATCSSLPSASPGSLSFFKDPFLTYGRWAVVTGFALVVLFGLAGIVYLLGRWIFNTIRDRRASSA